MKMNVNVVMIYPQEHKYRTMMPSKFNFEIYIQVDATNSTILSVKMSMKYAVTQSINDFGVTRPISLETVFSGGILISWDNVELHFGAQYVLFFINGEYKCNFS